MLEFARGAVTRLSELAAEAGQYEWVFYGLGVLSIVTLALSAVGVPFLLARLPADYYVREDIPSARCGRLSGIGLNALGLALVLAGVVMLVLPGQGLLTILAGLAVAEFPGKRRLERRVLSTPGVARVVAWIRRRRGKPPLQL